MTFELCQLDFVHPSSKKQAKQLEKMDRKAVLLGDLAAKSQPKNAAARMTEHAFKNTAELLSWTHKGEVTKFCLIGLFVCTNCMMAS